MRCSQGIDRQKSQGRWAINQDVLVGFNYLHEDLLQALLARLQGHKLNFRLRQVTVRRHDIDAIHHAWQDHLDGR